MIQVAYINTNDNTPVIDIKPYTPSLDRVETPGVPSWCSGWPKSTEESGCFNWEVRSDYVKKTIAGSATVFHEKR